MIQIRKKAIYKGICILILNCVHSTNAFDYPDEVPKSFLTEGCTPWVDGQCPARMVCYVDPFYPKWGQCGCRNGWFYRMAPPKNLGNELAPAPHRNDCVAMGPINILSFLCQFFAFSMFWYMSLNSILNLYRVYKNGGLKLNSSTVAFILCVGTTAGEGLRHTVYMTNRWGSVLDPYWEIKDALLTLSNYLVNQFQPWMVRPCVDFILSWMNFF